jgi:threonine dehydratase
VLIGIEDVLAAKAALKGIALRTPLLPYPSGTQGGNGLWLKPECFQPTGSFKVRGANNAVRSLAAQGSLPGVVTHSSGNHGQALAHAAQSLGIPCVVVMPDNARELKVTATRLWGARIEMVPAAQRESRARALAEELGYTLIPPYDLPAIIAGQGTVGVEIVEDLPDVETVLVPVGGGGLSSGVATAVKALAPRARVVGVEPELAADAAEGLRGGARVVWPAERTGRTDADGLRTNLSDLTFEHLNARLDGIVTVTERQISDAVAELARTAHVVAEPSGAVAPAAALFCADELPGGRTVAVVSGGNIDPAYLCASLTQDAA